MAKRRSRESRAERKRRTREHVLEDLSLHFVAGFVLRSGFTIERTTADYGIDLWMLTYNERGEVEQDLIWLQIKASESLGGYVLKGEAAFSFPVEVKDLRLWVASLLPVYLIVFDATLEEAYWMNIHEAVDDGEKLTGRYRRLRIPRRNIFGMQTVCEIRDYKNNTTEIQRKRRQGQ